MNTDKDMDLPAKVRQWIGKAVVSVGPLYTAEESMWRNLCVAVQDANPLYWSSMTGEGETAIAPPAMLPTWVIEDDWSPNPNRKNLRTLELHFMLKDALQLPYGVVTEVELSFHRPIRVGDRIRSEQVLVDIGPAYKTRMGPGRRWTIDVNYYHEDGALAGVQTLGFVSYRKDAKA